MTAALAAVSAVAAVSVVAVVYLLVTGRRRDAALRRERARADEAAARLRAAQEATRQREVLADEAEARASDAERESHAARQRALGAELRAAEAEQRAADAERRAQAASGRGVDRTLWALEQMSFEREWSDLVGPGVALPVAWDGSVAAAVGTELALIREVMGTPSELKVEAPAVIDDPIEATWSVRMCVEMLRLLARSGEEMSVTVSVDAVTVAQPAAGPLPEMARLVEAARAAGRDLSVESSEETSTVRLQLSNPAR